MIDKKQIAHAPCQPDPRQDRGIEGGAACGVPLQRPYLCAGDRPHVEGARGASTLEPDVRKELRNGGNVKAAAVVGKRIAEKAKAQGVEQVAFDRAGFKYHGRVKALAEAAREAGLKF